jgi:hypothetical protein
VTKWHPATKLLALAALLVLPYLLWTRPAETVPEVVASVSRTESGAFEPAATEPPSPFVLPPLEQFTAVVERPLFSPSRRMPTLPAEAEPEVAAPAPEVLGDQGPPEPELRFFGTVTRGGEAAALVTFPATAEVTRLRPGDAVGEWEVLSVERNRLELGLGGERRSFEIFGVGVSAPAPKSAPALAPQSSDIPGVDPAGDAYYGDDAPGQE